MAAPAELPRVPVGPELDNRRVAAALIDLAVPVALALAVTILGLDLTLPILIAVVGWTLFYFFALESDGGQTLGKRVMGVRVVRPDGAPADLRQVAIRTVVRIADGHVVGLIAMLVTGERRQRLGDLAAGTVVTRADAVPAEEPPQASPHATTAVLPPARDDLPPARDDLPPAGDLLPFREDPPALRDDLPPPRDDLPPPRDNLPPPRDGSPPPRDDLRAPLAVSPAPPVPASPPPLAEGPDLSAYLDREPVVEPLAAPGYDDEPESEAASEPWPTPDDDGPVVKPIETISAIDQVMQEADEQHRRSG